MRSPLDHQMMKDKENLEGLRRKGFTEQEIERLSQLCRNWSQFGEYLTAQEGHRLAFVRWLVVTRKLVG